MLILCFGIYTSKSQTNHNNIIFIKQLKQYFVDTNFPEWTKSSVGITTPLTLPEKSNTMLKDDGDPNSEREAECLIPTCKMKYPVPKQHGDYLRHLLEDHKIVIGMKISVTYLLFFTHFRDFSFIDTSQNLKKN